MKKHLAKVLAALVMVSLGAPALPALAADAPSAWAANSVNSAVSWGLVPEEVQGRYQDNMTREDFAILLDEVCNDVSGGKMTFIHWDNYNANGYNDEGHPFTDTENFAVKRMYLAGIMAGIGDGKFGPDQILTREQAATMIDNLFTFCSKPLPAASPTFADNGSISDWAYDSVGKIQAAGIMSGMGNNQFVPQGYYTREQGIVTALKAYNILVGNAPMGTGNTGDTPTAPATDTPATDTPATETPTTGQSTPATFSELYDSLTYYNNLIEIANATETNPPSTDEFPKIDSSLKSQYPDQAVAIGYLEAARQEMVKAVACWISIEVYGMMGYTQSTLYNRVQSERTKISQHVANAYDYLAKAAAAAQ